MDVGLADAAGTYIIEGNRGRGARHVGRHVGETLEPMDTRYAVRLLRQ